MTQAQFLSGVHLIYIQFSFSYTECCATAKKYSLPYNLLIDEGKNRWIHGFHKGINAKWNVNTPVQNLNFVW